MQEWEKRMYHERAVHDAFAKMLGLPPLVHPKGGCKMVKVTSFSSKLFYPELEKSGHDNCEFHTCKCSQK